MPASESRLRHVRKQLEHRQKRTRPIRIVAETGALDIETSDLHGDKPEIRPDRRARHAHPAGSDIIDKPPARPKGQESTFAGTASARSPTPLPGLKVPACSHCRRKIARVTGVFCTLNVTYECIR